MAVIFHIALAAEWAAAQATGQYDRSTIELSITEEGFMHCSYEDQVAGVAQRYYANETRPLVLLRIDTDKVVPEIKVENGFPHIYGLLNTDAVVGVEPFHA